MDIKERIAELQKEIELNEMSIKSAKETNAELKKNIKKLEKLQTQIDELMTA